MKRQPAISAYTPSNTDREVLKRIFVQRERLLDKIVERLARSMLTDDKHHVLLVGPRGSGKTHLVTLVEYELRGREELSDAMRVAWLGEDDTFTGLIDLALGLADQLATEYPDEFDTDYRASVRGLDADDAAESILKSIVARLGKRSILLIMENLDGVFDGLGDMGRKKWRAFLQEHPRIATLATSQRLFPGIAGRDEAFFGFFDIKHLRPLSVDDARELIRKISLEQGNQALANYLTSAEGRYRVRALHHLAGGNHRIYVLLAEFLTKESLDDLVAAFEGLAEDLTPYFQERVRSLPPQQARIVQCLCNISGAMTVKRIAEETFIAEGNCSKQLGNLKQKGYVQSQKRGKESFYEMAEPLMRLCLEVKNQRGRPLRLVAKFLRAWFPKSYLETPVLASGAPSRGDAYRAAALETDTSIESFLRASLNEEIALFALPDTMVAGASRDQVIAALETAFRTGDREVEAYGGNARDLLTMVLRRGHQEWEDYVTALVPLYVNHRVAAKLGQGVTHTIALLAAEGYSESQLDLWNEAWQRSGQGCEELEIPLQSLDAAVEAIKAGNDRPLFRLPLEIRELVRPLLAQSLSE